MARVLEELHRHAGMQNGLVMLLDPNSGELLVSAVYANNAETMQAVRYQPGEGLVGAIFSHSSNICDLVIPLRGI